MFKGNLKNQNKQKNKRKGKKSSKSDYQNYIFHKGKFSKFIYVTYLLPGTKTSFSHNKKIQLLLILCKTTQYHKPLLLQPKKTPEKE